MFPILLTLGPYSLFGHTVGPLHFYSYGLCLAVALGLSIYLYARDVGKYIAPKMRLTYQEGVQKTFDLGIQVIIFSIFGARLFYVLENHQEFWGKLIDSSFVWHPLGFINLTLPVWMQAFFIWQGGLVFYGGLFGALVAAFAWMQKEKWPLSYSFDLVTPYILLGHAIGRVGCFLNGCCYGIEDPHGMVFKGGEDQLPHLPTQLWELYGDLALFFFLLWVRRWTIRYSWLTIALYGFTYGLLRYVIEIWRLDRSVHFLFTFRSVSQATSAVIVVLSLVVILVILFDHWKVKKSPSN